VCREADHADAGDENAERSWLNRPSHRRDGVPIADWLAEAERACDAAQQAFAGRRWRRARMLAPGVSVIVVAMAQDELEGCLQSLVEQTLDRRLFEVIAVVDHGSVGETIRAALGGEARIEIKVIELAQPAAAAITARNAGIAAARRRYTTFLNAVDHVSSGYLEVVLARAAPGIVVSAPIVESPEPDAEADRERLSIQFIGGKAASTDLLHETLSSSDIADRPDETFWSALVLRTHREPQHCPPSDGAVYFRHLTRATEPKGFETAVLPELKAIADLERLASPHGRWAVDLVQAQISAHAERIGRYLREHPGDHRTYVNAVDGAPITHFPYELATPSPAKRLAIAFAFPPYVDTSAVVAAKRLRATGELVDVIANAMDSIREVDETVVRIAGPFIARQAFLKTPSYFGDWGSIEQFAVAGREVIREWETVQGPYESVYSRAHFAASHFLAALYKLSRPSVAWTAEFSDPLSRDVHGQERGKLVRTGPLKDQLGRGLRRLRTSRPRSRNLFVWAEEIAYSLADELIFTNENQLDYMLSYCSNPGLAGLARAKAVVKPHPSLPRQFYAMLDSPHAFNEGMINIAYFGNVYATRGLDDVLKAMTDRELRDRVVLHIFTTRQEEIVRRATELGVHGRVRVNGFRSYLEFLNLTTKFDCLLVNDAETSGTHQINPYLPSKWSDYRGSGRPVWGLVEPGSPLSRQSLDFVSPVGDVSAARTVLAQLVATRPDRVEGDPP
jgi:hypothetical protein